MSRGTRRRGAAESQGGRASVTRRNRRAASVLARTVGSAVSGPRPDAAACWPDPQRHHMAFDEAFPPSARLSTRVLAKQSAETAFAARGIETAEQWWDALAVKLCSPRC
jgi:hypothetical protein